VVTLRQYVRADQESFTALASDPDVMRYVGLRRALTEEQARADFAKNFDTATSDPAHFIAVVDEDGEYAGHCEIFRRQGRTEWEINYFLRRKRWGQSLGGQVVDLLLREAQERALPFLIATADERNIASLAILRRRGFVRDETLSASLGMNALRLTIGPVGV